MSSSQELRRAIDTARAGRNHEARDLFLKLVEDDPQSEAAWIWLSGLVDSIEDKIIACENALTLNPGNDRVRNYLMQLQKKQDEAFKQDQRREAQELFQEAKACAEEGDVGRALSLAQESTQRHPDNEAVWLLIADISSSTGQQVAALEKAVAVNPANPNTLLLLRQARQLRDNPLGVAAHYEQMGKFDEALSLYDQLASRTKDPREFDRIYKDILRIEALKKEKIQFVAPRSSIFRLAFAWPLLYFFLVLVQVGLNPFRHPALHLWLGLPLVAVGSFLLSLSEVRSQHVLWKELFSEEGDGSSFARRVTAAAGWLFVIFPHVLLLIDSLNRLNLLQIPPEPF